MSHLIRLVYASRSTFARGAQHQGLDPGVARILAKSRKNNAQRQIVGGLLFGDGCFLQCLEGEAPAVESLYAKIAADPRHKDVTVLMRRTISQRSFGAWSMKYVPGESALRDSLRAWGTPRFDPYALTVEQIVSAVERMRQEADAVDTLPGDLDDDAVPAHAREPADGAVRKSKPSSAAEATQSAASRETGRPSRRVGLLLLVAIVAIVGIAAAVYGRLG